MDVMDTVARVATGHELRLADAIQDLKKYYRFAPREGPGHDRLLRAQPRRCRACMGTSGVTTMPTSDLGPKQRLLIGIEQLVVSQLDRLLDTRVFGQAPMRSKGAWWCDDRRGFAVRTNHQGAVCESSAGTPGRCECGASIHICTGPLLQVPGHHSAPRRSLDSATGGVLPSRDGCAAVAYRNRTFVRQAGPESSISHVA